MSETPKPPMNVQDGFFNQLRKENIFVFVYLMNGKRLAGKVRRFDRYCVVLEIKGKEVLIYKHGIASVVHGGDPSEEYHPHPD
jgi:host factor-I protein